MRVVVSLIAAVALATFAGCMNVYNRAPWTRGKIVEIYQSSSEAAEGGDIVVFPADAGRWE